MATPTSTALLVDPNGNPIPQVWDPILSAWYAFATINTFAIGGAAGNALGYHFGAQALGAAGWFKGGLGAYKGAVAAWIMVFNSTTAPGNGTVPLYSTPVGPATGGVDQPWSLSPATPRYVSSGIWVAISTTGGQFTATANTDMTGTVEFYAVGT
jgi:hypothetical protein